MAQEQIKNPILIEFLKTNRENLNSLFTNYKFNYPKIEKNVVFFYIQFIIEPFVEKNSNRVKEELSATLLVLYEKILELIGKNFLGNSGRYPFFEKKFIYVLENPNEFLFENPDTYISSISNAIINIGLVDIEKLEKWMEKFDKLTKNVKSMEELFLAGTVGAWVLGMPQYRQKSLEICKNLKGDTLDIIFGTSNIRNINLEKFLDRLTKDPWISPESAMKENSPPKKFILKRVGGFTGFGEEFLNPPLVEILENEFIVYDKKNFYVLFTDYFGSSLQRISEDTYLGLFSEKLKKTSTPFSISKQGKVKFQTNELEYKPLANYSSYAGNENTFCITSPYSHSIFIIGLG